MSKAKDLTGLRVGRLTVIGQAERRGGRPAWRCICDCGNETAVITTSLTTGRTRSCGCLNRERTTESFTKHGQYQTRLYRIWSNMIQRCSNPNNDNYHRYGENGITVCQEWRNYKTFSQWAFENGYSDKLSIDRIENDKGYCPENCRWVTPQEQTDNRNCTRHISYDGKTKTLKRWSEETGIPYNTLQWRIQKGWSSEKALTTN